MQEEVAARYWKPSQFLLFLEKFIMFLFWGLIASFSASIIIFLVLAGLATQYIR